MLLDFGFERLKIDTCTEHLCMMESTKGRENGIRSTIFLRHLLAAME